MLATFSFAVLVLSFVRFGSTRIPIPTTCLYNPSHNAEYIGCFKDYYEEVSPDEFVRLFDYLYIVNGQYDHLFMTNDVCIMICRDRGFLYAATEAGLQCICGNDPYKHPTYFYEYHGCWENCYGNLSQQCGGQNRASVYKTGITDMDGSGIFKGFMKATSVQLSGTPIYVIFGETNMSCAMNCSMNKLCGLFTFDNGTCTLFGFFSSGICYEVNVGLHLSTGGEDLFIMQ